MSDENFFKILLAIMVLLVVPSCGVSQEIADLSWKDYEIAIDQEYVTLGDKLEKHRALLSSARRGVRFEEVYNRYEYVYSLNEVEIASYINFTNTIDTIQVFTKNIKTYRGLGVGNTRKQILAKYPRPTYENSEVVSFSLPGPTLSGWTWNLNFFFKKENLFKFSYNIAGP
ncbi:MAG: hypothetical protein FD137_657 [Spirochaetes bacterium]|nr:MAG: hypothetical protein FD137_657 [Spirochaetota bacterium]